MKHPDTTPEQRAALERAKRPRIHPYRQRFYRPSAEDEAKAERVVPFKHRVVRR